MSRLPNLSSLRAFDAAARQGSFVRASEELGVTPAAVSHQIKKLEEEIGVQLFLRGHKSARLTDAGRRYAKRVAQGFSTLMYREANQKTGLERVVLEVDSMLCRFWLLPQLATYGLDLAFLELDIRTHSGPLQTLPVDTDIAITRGAHDRDGFKRFRLLSPRLVGISNVEQTVTSLHEINGAPLIHYKNDEDWTLLCKAAGAPYPKDAPSIYFDRPEPILDATKLGMGLGTAEDVLVANEFDANRLALIPGASLTGRSYYMSTRKPRLSDAAAKLADVIGDLATKSSDWQSRFASSLPPTKPKP
jgi:LysR family glycine cleavage system transcriptional activator